MNMCSGQDIFRMIENRQDGEIESYIASMKALNPDANMKKVGILKTAGPKAKARENLNPRRMHDEAQMVRRVKAYLAQRTITKNEDELKKLSQKCESDPERPKPPQIHTMNTHPSTTSVTSVVSTQSVRPVSPSPSNISTTSSTSLVSEGRKSTNSAGQQSGAKKFGTASPQAVRKLMSLSEPGKTRQRRAKHSVSSLHSINSPPGSPPPTNAKKVKGHERSQSDCSVTQPVSLSAESSSVTSLPARKHLLSHAIGGAKSKMPPTLNSIEKSQQNHLQHKIRLARTISREPEVKESSVDDDDEDDDGQVSAV